MAAPSSSSVSKTKSPFLFIGVFLLLIAFTVGVLSVLLSHSKDGQQTSTPTPTQTVPEAPHTITIWAWNTAAKSLQALVPSFNKIHPEITVKVLEIPHDEANDKFRLAVTTGTGFPDVWDTEGPLTYEYIKANALMDITDLASKYKDSFVSYKWAEVTQNGHIYALPWDSAPVVLFYRRDLFTNAGVDPNSIETWDDYIVAGHKLTQGSGTDGKPTQYMTLMSRQADVGDTFQILLSQFGGSLFTSDGRPSINTPQGLQAIKLMKKIMDSGITANVGWWTPEFYEAIKNGTVASLPQGAWMGGQIKDIAPALSGKWGVIPLPAVNKGGVRSAVRGGSNLAVPVKATNKEDAWKFIEFALANKDSQLTMYNQYNIFPALKETYTDPVANAPNPYFANQITTQVYSSVQNDIPANYFYGPFYDQSTKILSQEIVNVLNSVKTPEQALLDAQTTILQRLSK